MSGVTRVTLSLSIYSSVCPCTVVLPGYTVRSGALEIYSFLEEADGELFTLH